MPAIIDLMRDREVYYRFADYTIDTSDLSVNQVVEEVLKRWKEAGE
ncbi:MAG: hypothetical protein H5U02_09715 [Clostridia bacterium]|nr:hypothetical protein [Clostridia bacterium]